MKVQICNNSGQLESFAPHHRGRDIRIPSKYIIREPKRKATMQLHTATYCYINTIFCASPSNRFVTLEHAIPT